MIHRMFIILKLVILFISAIIAGVIMISIITVFFKHLKK